MIEMAMTLDPLNVILEGQILEAREAIVELAAQRPDYWWTGHELKAQARRDWSSAVMGLAFRRLIAEGHFEQRRDLRVKPKPWRIHGRRAGSPPAGA